MHHRLSSVVVLKNGLGVGLGMVLISVELD